MNIIGGRAENWQIVVANRVDGDALVVIFSSRIVDIDHRFSDASWSRYDKVEGSRDLLVHMHDGETSFLAEWHWIVLSIERRIESKVV